MVQQQEQYVGGKGLVAVLMFLPCAALLLLNRIYGKLEPSFRFIIDEPIVVNQTLEMGNPSKNYSILLNTSNTTRQNVSFAWKDKPNITANYRPTSSLLLNETALQNQSIQITNDTTKQQNISLSPIGKTNEFFSKNISFAINETTYRPLGTRENPITMVVRMSGEMGNHLAKLAYGHSLKWLLEEDYNISTSIILQHQDNGKWKKCVENIQTCFVNTRSWSFSGVANTDEFKQRKQEQDNLLGENNRTYFEFDNCQNKDCILDKVQFIAKNLPKYIEDETSNKNHNITLPFIFADEFASFSYFNDRYHARIKSLLLFDWKNPLCCNQTADSDETVLHIRGFLKEMPRKGKSYGFEELSPRKMAHELLKQLEKGNKVTLVGRVPDGDYTNAMQERGLNARYMTGQSPTQDFCFLMSATKEMVGYTMSSYAIYAAYLGNATKARLYSLKSPERLERLGTSGYFYHYNWTDSVLKDRVAFEIYNSEEQDEIELAQK